MVSAGQGQFDADIGIEQVEQGQWRAEMTNNWSVTGIPNGGYQLALATEAIRAALPHERPLTITGHYLSAAKPGTTELLVDVARIGGSMSTATCNVIQDETEILRVTSTFINPREDSGPTHIEGVMPAFQRPEECPALADLLTGPFHMHKHLDVRLAPGSAGWTRGEKGERAEFLVWTRFADGRDPDVAALPLFVDAIPPPLFNVLGAIRYAPTLELTMHVRGVPAPGYLRGRFRTRYLIDGLFEEDGELWDSQGRLVALSRQVGIIRLPSKGGPAR